MNRRSFFKRGYSSLLGLIFAYESLFLNGEEYDPNEVMFYEMDPTIDPELNRKLAEQYGDHGYLWVTRDFTEAYGKFMKDMEQQLLSF